MTVVWVVGGALAGIVVGWVLRTRIRRAIPRAPDAARSRLEQSLIGIGDALNEVSVERLQQRGNWDRTLFDDVLAHVEQQVPGFQAALSVYLAGGAPSPERIAALLAVDRLSAAYTYWTRLFPPRQQDDSMFVLSLLHDLSEKVEHAIRVLGQN